MAIPSQTALARARSCLRVEREALAATARRLDASFVATARAVDRALAAGGKLIFTGVGKRSTVSDAYIVEDGVKTVSFPSNKPPPIHDSPLVTTIHNMGMHSGLLPIKASSGLFQSTRIDIT